ncbi:hypothetical protein EROM_111710 [Encephalitozoon romaleae SJ-2008]|uniref:Uncharacterized protein n=1 Tax=Encephalitozoon romaleae (strain SJ-2008) TaxID=1178016 RepID=I7AUL1_ENCRO|nr:hypothetical protein EROM_111710 [Encephalitozoon romaleae SJ-2008]AFN84152.1 hypothetical protein EROM_111710 [Encephalitozoon romaleae SJ-2008]
MNSNFFNQQNKDDNNQKNPFLNTPFGSQQNTFGNQVNKPNIFGGQSQQTGAFGTQPTGGMFNSAPPAGFGGSGQGFSAQGFLNKQNPSTGFNVQQPQPSTSLFGKSSNLQPNGSSSIFGGQSTLQPSESPFKPQPTAPSSGVFGTQQLNNTFGTQFQPQTGNAFGTQAGGTSQPVNPFASSIQDPLSTGIRSTQDQGNVESSRMASGNGFGASQSSGERQNLGPQMQQAIPSNPQASGPFSTSVHTAASTLGTQQNIPFQFTPAQESQPGASSALPSPVAPLGSEPLSQGTEARDADSSVRKARGSASVFNQGVGEKGVSFMQMTLGEIIQQQTRKLEENIRVFKEKAKEVFEQDERIIRSLNNYKLIRNRIEEEERVIAETEENVEFFEKWLCNFQEEVPEGSEDELLMCIKEFERVCDKYNKTIETLKDEEDEVMCLVNENYNLITTIEEKLEILERY